MAEKKHIDPKSGKVTFHNKILQTFKSYHVDGAYGGITPRGLIALSFFTERFPIPKSQDYEIVDGGRVGSKISDSEDSLIGIIRQYEVSVYMDVNVCRELINLLTSKLSEYDAIVKETAAETKQP
jgi:hypothetical protein